MFRSQFSTKSGGANYFGGGTLLEDYSDQDQPIKREERLVPDYSTLEDRPPIGKIRVGYKTLDREGEYYIPQDVVSEAYYGKPYDRLSFDQRVAIQGLELNNLYGEKPIFDQLDKKDEISAPDLKKLLTQDAIMRYNHKWQEHGVFQGNSYYWDEDKDGSTYTGKRIRWPKSVDTDISRFMSGYLNEKSLVDEAKRRADEYGVDPYELLVALNFEGNHNLIRGHTKDATLPSDYFNTHDVSDILLGHRYSGPYSYKPTYSWETDHGFGDNLDTVLKDVGIYQSGKPDQYSFDVLNRSLMKYENELDRLPRIPDMNNVARIAAIAKKYGWNRMNPAQKGWNGVKNSYSDMVKSQATKLRQLYPNLFSDEFNGWEEYGTGGSIHIAPSKRGTFTAAAKKHGKSVQAFASQVLAHKENYSPAMVKKANFARNAAKWHAEGGFLDKLSEYSPEDILMAIRKIRDTKG